MAEQQRIITFKGEEFFLGHRQYFTAMNLVNAKLPVEESQEFRQFASSVGSMVTRFRPLMDHLIIGRELRKNAQVESYLQCSENLSNLLFEDFYPENTRKKIDQNKDHGFFHSRRVEKWFKEFIGRSRVLRGDIPFLFFAPAIFSAIRDHDLFKLFTGLDEGHDEAAALVTLGRLLQSYDRVEALTGIWDEPTKKWIIHPVSKEDWNKIVWASAFICYYHSSPESIPNTEDILNNGLLDLSTILKNVRAVSEQHKTSLESLFFAFKLIKPLISEINKGEIKAPDFTSEEIEALKLATRIMAAADKFDALYPSGLSLVRTFLSKPDRDFYRRINDIAAEVVARKGELAETYKDELTRKRIIELAQAVGKRPITTKEETELRVLLGQGESPDDVCRLCFELARIEAFGETTPYVTSAYGSGLLKKGKYIGGAVIGFLTKKEAEEKADCFLSAYQNLRDNIKIGLLIEATYPRSSAESIIKYSSDEHIKTLLRENGINPQVLDVLLRRVDTEEGRVRKILNGKIAKLTTSAFSSEDSQRVTDIIEELISFQKDKIRVLMGGAEKPEELAYVCYWPLEIKNWRLQS